MYELDATVTFLLRENHFRIAVDDFFCSLDHSGFVCQGAMTVLPSYATDVTELRFAAASDVQVVSWCLSSIRAGLSMRSKGVVMGEVKGGSDKRSDRRSDRRDL